MTHLGGLVEEAPCKAPSAAQQLLDRSKESRVLLQKKNFQGWSACRSESSAASPAAAVQLMLLCHSLLLMFCYTCSFALSMLACAQVIRGTVCSACCILHKVAEATCTAMRSALQEHAMVVRQQKAQTWLASQSKKTRFRAFTHRGFRAAV